MRMARQQGFSHRAKNASLIVLFVPVVLLILPFTLVAIILHLLYKAILYCFVWLFWVPKGKDTLFIYSDSPVWCEYMTAEVLPLVKNRAIVLNWSERKKWCNSSLAVALFRHFGRGREFNPLVVVFRPFRRARVFRFFSAFKAWKRGYREPLERLRRDLSMALIR